MEHPHENYHMRPFPQQPKRGGKELKSALEELKLALTADVPDLEGLRGIQAKIHAAAANYNDDKLIDMLRTLSFKLEQYIGSPQKIVGEKLTQQLLKILMELRKH